MLLVGMLAVTLQAADKLAFSAAIVPKATVFYQINAEQISQDSPLAKKLQDLWGDLEDDSPFNEALGGYLDSLTTLLEAGKTFQKELKIERDDVLRAQSTICFDSLTFVQGKLNTASIDALSVFKFKKSINLGDIVTAADRISSNQGIISIAVADEAFGIPMQKTNVVVDAANNEVVTLAFALPNPADGTVLYVGPETSVRAALERYSSQKPVPLLEALVELKKSVSDDAAAVVLFSPTDQMRDYLRKQGAGANQPPMVMVATKTLSEMTGVAFNALVKEKMDLQLAFSMRTAEDAALFKNIVDGMLVATLKMMVMQKAGKAMPLTESMQSKLEGKTVVMTAALTVADLEILSATKPEAEGLPMGVPAQ